MYTDHSKEACQRVIRTYSDRAAVIAFAKSLADQRDPNERYIRPSSAGTEFDDCLGIYPKDLEKYGVIDADNFSRFWSYLHIAVDEAEHW
jgi:hypothetical protein